MELRSGVRVKGIIDGTFYTGTVDSVYQYPELNRGSQLAAGIKRDDRLPGAARKHYWEVWQKSDGTWGASGDRGKLIVVSLPTLPWEP